MHITQNLVFLSSVLLAFLSKLSQAVPLCSSYQTNGTISLPPISFPDYISERAVKEFQLALFLENLEAQFFSTGLANVTAWGTASYPNNTIEIINKITQQEETHVATIAELLEYYDAMIIPPCNYSFPVTSTTQFLELGDMITSTGIATVIGLADRISSTDPLLIKSVASIVTVESRHDAFFRLADREIPNPAPFDTGISGIWAYNIARHYIVPNSCPIEIPLPILPTLSVNGSSTDSTMEFIWNPDEASFLAEAGEPLFVAWLNQLNPPIYSELTITEEGKGYVEVPDCLRGVGVTFAAVTSQKPNDAEDLALATLAGPVILKLL